MAREKRTHSPEFKAAVALEALAGKSAVSEVARRHGVHSSLVHGWRNTLMGKAHLLLSKSALAKEIGEDVARETERELVRLSAENEWLQKAVRRLSLAERRAAVEMDNPSIPLLRQVKILNVNRSGVYYRKNHQPQAQNQADAG